MLLVLGLQHSSGSNQRFQLAVMCAMDCPICCSVGSNQCKCGWQMIARSIYRLQLVIIYPGYSYLLMRAYTAHMGHSMAHISPTWVWLSNYLQMTAFLSQKMFHISYHMTRVANIQLTKPAARQACIKKILCKKVLKINQLKIQRNIDNKKYYNPMF